MMNNKEKLLWLLDKTTPLKTWSFLEDLQRTEKLSASAISDLQWARLQELLEFAYRKTAFYRQRFDRIGLRPSDLKCREDFAKIPLLTREELGQHRAQIKSGESDFFIRSSGSTGRSPSQTHVDFKAASQKYAVYLRHLLRSGWDFDTKIIHFLPSVYEKKIVDRENGIKQLLSTFVQNEIAHAFFTSREVLFYDGLSPIIEKEKLKYYFKKINAFKNVIIMGRGSFLGLLAHNLRMSGWAIVKPRAIVNIGELLPEPLAQRIAAVFDAPVYNIYGSAELSYIAGSCPQKSLLHLNEETHYVETVKDGDGSSISGKWGNIVVTDLFNHSMPLIRYQVGDVGHIRQDGCGCGGSRLLEVGGRQEALIKLNGRDPISEKEICDDLLDFENIWQFKLEFRGNGAYKLEIVGDNVHCHQESIMGRLKAMGFDKVSVNFTERLDDHVDKMRYVKVQDMSSAVNVSR
ncbi:MAG: phenylacetate--CoA ligase family protein [Candidatus Omnitrophica bacterium]|nr:phenylacetate--CoA ligase family protein [Candidatus Omnitrophota bacterium]